MSKPKSLTKAIWKSMQHCFKTRLAKYVPEQTSNRDVRIIIDESAGTAYQTVNEAGEIILGFGSELAKHNDTGHSMTEFYKRVLFHEMGHGIETVAMETLIGSGDHTAGRKKMLQDLADNGIPYQLFNLFEDVRLEGLQRRSKYGLSRFHWSKWQNSMTENGDAQFDACAVLYEMKMQENGRDGMKALQRWCRQKYKGNEFLYIRRRFFNKLVGLQTDEHTWASMLRLMKDWVRRYGSDVTGIPAGPTGGDDLGIQEGLEGTEPSKPLPIPVPKPKPKPSKPKPSGGDEDGYFNPADLKGGTGNMTIVIGGKSIN